MISNIRVTETSPQIYARIGGVLYLVIIVAGIFGELFVRGKLIMSGEATATADNIMDFQLLWRIGITADLIMHVCDVLLMLAIYILLRPVNKNLALLAVLFNLIQTAVLVANKLNLIAALLPLESADYLKAFEPQQQHALVYLSLKLHGYGFHIGLLFFAFVCLVQGYLIIKSEFLPRILGVLMQIAGLCYLTNSFAHLLFPKFANMMSPGIMIPCFVAELSFCLWLLVKGVNVPMWNKQARVEQFGETST